MRKCYIIGEKSLPHHLLAVLDVYASGQMVSGHDSAAEIIARQGRGEGADRGYGIRGGDGLQEKEVAVGVREAEGVAVGIEAAGAHDDEGAVQDAVSTLGEQVEGAGDGGVGGDERPVAVGGVVGAEGAGIVVVAAAGVATPDEVAPRCFVAKGVAVVAQAVAEEGGLVAQGGEVAVGGGEGEFVVLHTERVGGAVLLHIGEGVVLAVGRQAGDAGHQLVVGVEVLPRGVHDAVESLATVGGGQHEGEHPFVEAHAAGGDIGQLEEHLVPPLLELYADGLAGREVLIPEIDLGVDALAGVGPCGGQDLLAVEVDVRTFAVPVACIGGFVVLGAAVVLELDEGPDGLCLGRIDIGPGISGGVRLGAAEEGGYGGAPGVAQIDAGARGPRCAVGGAIVGEGGGQDVILGFLGREDHVGIAVVGEGVGDAPAHIGLSDIGDGLAAEPCILVIEEAALPVGELIVLAADVGQRGAARLDVLLAAAHPAAFGSGQGVGIEAVLADDVALGGRLAVVP